MNFNIYLFFFFFFGGGGGGQITEYFWGYEDFVDIFGGHHKIRLYFEVISMHIRVFSEGQDTEWRIFLGLLKISNNYTRCMKFLYFFFFWGGGGGER